MYFSEKERKSGGRIIRNGDWKGRGIGEKKEEISLVEVKEGLTKISNAIANLNKNDVAVYSPDQIEVRLYASTVPGLNLDYFEIDELPELAEEKNNKEQIEMCFNAMQSKKWEALFD